MVKTEYYYSHRTRKVFRRKAKRPNPDPRVRPATYEEVQGFLIDEQFEKADKNLKIGIRRVRNTNPKNDKSYANHPHQRRSSENSE